MNTYQVLLLSEDRSRFDRARYRCTAGTGDDCGVWHSVCPQWDETPRDAAHREAQLHVERHRAPR